MHYTEIPISPYPTESVNDFIKRVMNDSLFLQADPHVYVRIECIESGVFRAFANIPVKAVIVDPHLS